MPFDEELRQLRGSHVALLRELVHLITAMSDGLENISGINLGEVLLEPAAEAASRRPGYVLPPTAALSKRSDAIFSLRLVAEELLTYRATSEEAPVLKKLDLELEWIADCAKIESLDAAKHQQLHGDGDDDEEEMDYEDDEDNDDADSRLEESFDESFTEESERRHDDSMDQTPVASQASSSSSVSSSSRRRRRRH